jgi:hypothetical protein
MFAGDFSNRLHVRALAIKMDWDNGLGPGSNRRLDLCRVDAFGLRIAIHQHCRRAGNPDGFGSGKKGVGVCDALVAGADPQGHQRQPNGVGPVADSNGVFGSAKGGELAFKAFKHRAEDVLAALDDLVKIGVNLGFDVIVLADVTVKLDFHHPTLGRQARVYKVISKAQAKSCATNVIVFVPDSS